MKFRWLNGVETGQEGGRKSAGLADITIHGGLSRVDQQEMRRRRRGEKT